MTDQIKVKACTCPSGDGSLRWPCPVHPPMTNHQYQPFSARGFGSWHTCSICGTSKHSGYYWLGGYKSKTEPPCIAWKIDPDWKAQAIPAPITEA